MPKPKMDQAYDEVLIELVRAIERFPRPFASAHEGFAILKEEVDELWDEVKTKGELGKQGRRAERMRAEAIQVAAMALRFIVDVCDGE